MRSLSDRARHRVQERRLPEPVLPEIRMLSRARTARSGTPGPEIVPSGPCPRCPSVPWLNLRIVTRAAERQRRDDGVDAAAVGGASTIGEDSSMRRPTWDHLVDDPPQVRFVVETHGGLGQRPARSTQTSNGLLTMTSRPVVGEQALDRTVAENKRRCRRPGECGRRGDARLVTELVANVPETRSRSLRSMLTLKSCGPRSPITAR
jgi:hypothetical protein